MVKRVVLFQQPTVLGSSATVFHYFYTLLTFVFWYHVLAVWN